MSKDTQVIDFSMRKEPVQQRSKVLVDALLDATARLLVEIGYTELTTNKVAETAGVGIGSLYEYFPNKESLVAKLIERNGLEIAATIQSSMLVALEKDHEEALRFWLEKMLEALEVRREEVRAVITGVPFLRELPLMRTMPKVLMDMALTARDGADKRVSFMHTEAAVYHLTTMVFAAILNMVIHPSKHIPRDVLLNELSELILRAIDGGA
ncbi:hypothetical protein A9Q99_03185 [Gammaproteobacteria bacterium 45_16_T64]|mgnify:CR=1 FL=1|nr:hypothetical protein A9Q99_03185 [Gammaproteobacteria bacterium 45_16_T64]